MQPGAKRSASIEFRQLLPGPQKGLLDHIFGVDFVSSHTIGQPEDSSGVEFDEGPEGVTIASLSPADNTLFGNLSLCHPVVRLDCGHPRRLGKCCEGRGRTKKNRRSLGGPRRLPDERS